MIRLLLSRVDGARNQPVEVSQISELITDLSNLIWLDVESPTGDDLNTLREEFGFHELALEDAIKRNQRPKIDRYDSFYFLVLYAISYDAAQLTINEHELDVFAGKNYLVTVRDGPVLEVDEVARRWDENAVRLPASVGTMLYTLVDTVVDDYFPVLDLIAESADEIESRIFRDFDPAAQEDIFQLRKELLNLRRVLGPERDVLLQLSRQDLPILEEGTQAYFQDVYDHIMRVTDSVDVFRDLLNSALDAYLSMSSHQLNAVMRTLTAVSIIMMSLSVIAGVYGMNFENMPELRTQYGYFAVLGVMTTLALSLYIFFRRRGWL